MRTVFGDYKVDQDGFQLAHKMVMFQWQEDKKVIVWPDDLAQAQGRGSRRRPGTSAERRPLTRPRTPAGPPAGVSAAPAEPIREPSYITPAMVGQVIISGILAGVALRDGRARASALIFGVMRIINVAHGPLLMLGAYTTFFLYSAFGLNPYLSLPCRMAVLFVVGILLQRTLVLPGGRRARAVVAAADVRHLHRARQRRAARVHVRPARRRVPHRLVGRRDRSRSRSRA